MSRVKSIPYLTSPYLLPTHMHSHTHPFSPGLPQFFLVGIHTKPSKAFDEINALVDVYDEAVSHYGTENGIILGDFNADCSYLSQKRYNMLELVTDSRFTWLLDTDADTTTKNSNCAYDRCVCVLVCLHCVCVCMCACVGVWVCGCVGVLVDRLAKREGLGGRGEDTLVSLKLPLTVVDSICNLSTTLANTLTISSGLQFAIPTGLLLLAASVTMW